MPLPRLRQVALGLTLQCACSGADPTHQIDSDNASPTAGGSSVDESSPGMAGAPASATPETPDVPVDCESESAPPSPLRRLTQREYENTVADLLGVAVSTSDFPTDPIGGGFDTNAAALSVSPLHAEKYLEAAEALAHEALTSRWDALVPCSEAAAAAAEAVDTTCAHDFVASFGRRAYRRPLSDDEISQLLGAFEVGREGAGLREGLELVIQTVLQSPFFLYRFELGAGSPSESGLVSLTDYELAARLSYFLWGSMPSDELLDAAEAGELAETANLASFAEAMLEDERASAQLVEFHRQWLDLRALDRLQKDPELFAELDDDLRAALAAELPAFVAHVWQDDRRLASLLTSTTTFVTKPLADLYGVEVSTDEPETFVELDPAERSGVLTQAAVLAVHALSDQSSPVARGKLVRSKLLCQEPPAPPANVNITPPKVDAESSTRERFAAHTAEPTCKACHELMDPIGFAFESYDALGRYRTSDGGLPVATSGWVSGSDDADGDFENAQELVERLAGSRQVHDCVATQWFRFGFGRPDTAADACSLAEARQVFWESDGDLRALLVALVQTESFRHRRALDPQEQAEAEP